LARLISTIVVLGLLGGTAAAFAITEGLKLERSPITGTRITSAFSPGISTAKIEFRLRKSDSVTATVIGPNRKSVQTLASDRSFEKGLVRLRWDGRNELNQIAPPGGYTVRVHLARRHQTIALPNRITIDRTPPRITITRVRPPVFSPDHDGRRDHVAIRFTVSETARPLLLVNGRRALRGRLAKAAGTLYWSGRVNGRRLAPGTYALRLRAQDIAGNGSRPSRVHMVVLRYLTLGRRVIDARAGSLFRLRLSSDARRIYWTLAGRSGVIRPGVRKIRAPARPGRHRLVLTENGRRAVGVVIVRRRP
jgi:hypothetical protein